MKQQKKIDKTLRQRRGILKLLERLKCDAITIDEMEEIGAKLQRSGRRALSPLVRKLWQEQSGDVIAKYTYLLDFFEDDAWLDQLMKIALTRTDLEDEGKSAFLSALEGYGVDISAPPFSRILREVGGPLSASLPRLMDKGEAGLIMFMEDFISYPAEIQQAIVREMLRVDDPRVVEILELLLGHENPDIVRETITALGMIRNSVSAAVLQRYLANGAEPLREAAVRSLRRLSFLGIRPQEQAQQEAHLPFHGAWVSPIDGSGNISLCLSRWKGTDSLELFFLECHEVIGIREAGGYGAVTLKEHDRLLGELKVEEEFVKVDPAYLLLMVRDALSRSIASNSGLPAEYYIRQRIFAGHDISPVSYMPAFDGYDLEQTASPGVIAESANLLDDQYFDSWFIVNGRISDAAVEINAVQQEGGADKVAEIYESYSRELITPQIEKITRRLFLAADLMNRAGREREVVELTLATAFSLSRSRLGHHHPFLRRFFAESVEMAREALAEGYDFRETGGDPDDEGEWE